MLRIDEASITYRLKNKNSFFGIIATFLVAILLGFSDFLVGSELSFSIFYLLPVTMAVIFSGKIFGLILSILCSIIWITCDILSGLTYDSVYIPIWNTMVRFGYFIFHTYLLSRLLETIKIVQDSAFHDPLTKVANWRYFEASSSSLIKSAIRENRKLSIAYIDVDNFKEINDEYGHGTGDEVLICLATIFKEEIRPQDLVARLGGDEFSIILYNTNVEITTEIMHRIISHVKVEMTNRNWNITLSVGVVVFSLFTSSLGPMLKTVDDLMYEVKKNGKNNIIIEEQ